MKNPGLHVEELLELLRQRRSRRFCMGMHIPDGPFRFQSPHPPCPLSPDQEAQLAFAASGITGGAILDLDFSHAGGGNIIGGKYGRTVASGDALHSVAVIVINDQGAHLLKRPQDLQPEEISNLINLAHSQDWKSIYSAQKVQILDTRPNPPKEPIHNLSLNNWSANAPGTSVFLPVNDLGRLYINGLLEIFQSRIGVYVLDERKNFQPAGVARFAQSKKGHLDDNPNNGKVVTIRHIETMVAEFAAIEQGMIMQNLALTAQSMNLAGYPLFANHEFSWFLALGFEMDSMPAGRYLGAPRWVNWILDRMGKNPDIPYPVSLTRNGSILMQSLNPDASGSMRNAVLQVVGEKFGNQGIFRSLHPDSPWKSEALFNEQIAGIEPQAIEATIAYCDYLWKNYRRFPVHLAPFRTITSFQAGIPDPEFYQKFMKSNPPPTLHK